MAATEIVERASLRARIINHPSLENTAATDPQDKEQWNHEFHKMINQAGGSRRLASVLRLLSRDRDTGDALEASESGAA